MRWVSEKIKQPKAKYLVISIYALDDPCQECKYQKTFATIVIFISYLDRKKKGIYVLNSTIYEQKYKEENKKKP